MTTATFMDPLGGFAWDSLYTTYDGMCRGFDAASPLLAIFEPERPASDRALYYKLIEGFAGIKTAAPEHACALYGSMLYWKLYSQHAVRGKIIAWRDQSRKPLTRLIAALPQALERRQAEVIRLIMQIGLFGVPGTKSSTAVPVRATLLHFLYPNVVPLFDRMVLKAVGLHREGASREVRVFEAYLPQAWALAERYRAQCSRFKRETPLRVIDMALWATRGQAEPWPCPLPAA